MSMAVKRPADWVARNSGGGSLDRAKHGLPKGNHIRIDRDPTFVAIWSNWELAEENKVGTRRVAGRRPALIQTVDVAKLHPSVIQAFGRRTRLDRNDAADAPLRPVQPPTPE